MFSTRSTERIAALERQIGSLLASVQWLQATVNQVQAERAVLLERVLGITLHVPVITQTPGQTPTSESRGPTPLAPSTEVAPFDLVQAFEDMGDEAAQQQGIDLTPDGFVSYTRSN